MSSKEPRWRNLDSFPSNLDFSERRSFPLSSGIFSRIRKYPSLFYNLHISPRSVIYKIPACYPLTVKRPTHTERAHTYILTKRPTDPLTGFRPTHICVTTAIVPGTNRHSKSADHHLKQIQKTAKKHIPSGRHFSKEYWQARQNRQWGNLLFEEHDESALGRMTIKVEPLWMVHPDPPQVVSTPSIVAIKVEVPSMAQSKPTIEEDVFGSVPEVEASADEASHYNDFAVVATFTTFPEVASNHQ
ncbi:hypothetical protein Fmac_024784 [Flemingia macrophylla]|uniref:Uncharacterized protein n=1 Tax=Flemingia macrophylla TaxID=520843 RepID=A0ABD1LQC6_9FABA